MNSRASTRRTSRNHLGVVVAIFVAVVALAASLISFDKKLARPASASGDALVVYESGGPFGHVGETAAIFTKNLVGHFGQVTAIPVAEYSPHLLDNFRSLIYIGALQRDRPLQSSFLDDVLATTHNVLWLGHNIDDLQTRQNSTSGSDAKRFDERFGFITTAPQAIAYRSVTYKGQTLTRAENAGLTIPIKVVQPQSARTTPPTPSADVLAEASLAEAPAVGVQSGKTNDTHPWAVRSQNLTYVSEVPFSYNSERDRYLIFADLLFDHLAPETPERHRALVRLEDVSPNSKPATLRKIADALFAERVPFSVQIIPEYVNPDLDGGGADPVVIRLSERPEVVDAINYMLERGGTLIMHGTTHQNGTRRNPYAGVTAEDFEFVSTHIDKDYVVHIDGPLPEDSPAWAEKVIEDGLAEIEAANMTRPKFWTTPHYAATPNVYRTLTSRFDARYERGMYSLHDSRATAPASAVNFGQFFPYVVRDTFGSVVIPENLGNQALPFKSSPGRSPLDIVNNAKANLVVRDGFASFFWHPYLAENPGGIADLLQIVRGIRNLGYTFVSPQAAAQDFTDPLVGPIMPKLTSDSSTTPTVNTDSGH